MLTDGKFDFRVVRVPAKYGKTIRLFCQGDVHYNSPNFASEKFKQDISEMRESCRTMPTYFILTGDMFEALSTSERQHFAFGFHDSNSSRWEQEYAREIDQFAKQVDFMKDRTLAVFGGNHFFSFYDGTTSDQALASKLKAPYIGCSGYVILILDFGKGHTMCLKIFAHHGKGAGRRAGGTFNALEDAASYFSDADIVLMGHDHRAGAMQLPALKCDMGKGGHYKIKEFNRIIGRTGSYLKSYEPGVPSYPNDACMRPSTLGCLELQITPKTYSPNHTLRDGKGKKRDDFRWVQIKAVV